MQLALDLAGKAALQQEVPVGAVIVRQGELVSQAFNQPIGLNDPTAHAEILAIRQAAQRLGNYRLAECELFVTIEPCAMCAGAMIHSRIKRLVYAAKEPKAGAVCSHLQLLDEPFVNHKVMHASGLLEQEGAALISDFFKSKRIK